MATILYRQTASERCSRRESTSDSDRTFRSVLSSAGVLTPLTIASLVGEASEADYDDLHTFSIGFDHAERSETKYAEAVAQGFRSEHTSHTVTASEVCDELDDIIVAMDQPTIDGENTYFVSKVAADAGLKVTLSGLGSDEIFFGSPSFENIPRWAQVTRTLYTTPSSIRQPIAHTFDQVGAPVLGTPVGGLADPVRADSPFGAAYVTQRGLFTSRQRQSLLDTDTIDWPARIEHDVKHTLDTSSTGNAVSHAELTWYMRNQPLRDTDVMSMTHSIEVRVPFLDTELAAYLMESSVEAKQNGEKQLFKDAIAEDVPLEVIEREKPGFTFPFTNWLADELQDLVIQSFKEDRLAQTPLDSTTCHEIRRSFDKGHIHWFRLWTLVVLSLWVDEHLSKE
jgi:asparagine synthase (glutamine-hydrolysing)